MENKTRPQKVLSFSWRCMLHLFYPFVSSWTPKKCPAGDFPSRNETSGVQNLKTRHNGHLWKIWLWNVLFHPFPSCNHADLFTEPFRGTGGQIAICLREIHRWNHCRMGKKYRSSATFQKCLANSGWFVSSSKWHMTCVWRILSNFWTCCESQWFPCRKCLFGGSYPAISVSYSHCVPSSISTFNVYIYNTIIYYYIVLLCMDTFSTISPQIGRCYVHPNFHFFFH